MDIGTFRGITTLLIMIAFLGVVLLISVYFRQVLSPLFIVLPLLMSLSWTFGLTWIVIGNLNQITVCLFAILFGLGIDFGIHIFARYREARRRGLTTEAALIETVCQTGSALTTTAVTTSVAFFSLLFSDFKGFSEFGFIVGAGIMFSLVAMLVVCPAFIVLVERLRLIRLQQLPHLLLLLQRARPSRHQLMPPPPRRPSRLQLPRGKSGGAGAAQPTEGTTHSRSQTRRLGRDRGTGKSAERCGAG